MNLRTLRFRLSWTHGLVISLVIVLIGFVRYKTVSYRSIRNFDAGLMSDAQFTVSRFHLGSNSFSWSSEGLTPGDRLTLEELISYVVVTDSDGNVLHKDLHSRYMQGLLTHGGFEEVLKQRSGYGQAVAADGTIYRFVSLPLPTGKPALGLTLHLGRSMDSLTGVLNEHLYVYLFSVPLILAISVPIGWYLAGRALRPFEEVARTAERITSKNLNTRITTKHKEEEIQRLVQAFNSMVMRLNDSFQQMRKFNADAAHELRTPLSILQGENEVALRTLDLPEDIHTVLASNLEELARLTRIINDMLTLAEADAGSQILHRKPTNLRPLLEDLLEQMRVLAMDRNIEIDCPESRDVVVEADSLWLRRALLNLLDNAIKYSKDGGRIEVCTRVQNGQVHLVVRDEGIGIAPDDLPHIFDRLYRADPARSRASGGAGLGLALVKWIVESHQGQIFVNSEVDRGTSFEVTLPVLDQANPENAA